MRYRKAAAVETRPVPTVTSTALDRSRDIAVLALMPLFFSSNLVIGRAAVAEVEPWTLAFLRWSLALALLMPLAAAGLAAERRALLRQWRRIALLGFLGMWVCGALVYIGLRSTTATNATLIYTSSTVMILVLERLFRGRRIATRQALGVVLAFLGVAVIVLGGDLRRLLGLDLNPGDLLIAFAALSWAIYSVILKQKGLARLPTLPLFAAIVMAGVVSLLPFMLWETLATGRFPATVSAWTSIAAIAVVSSVLALSSYQYAVKRFGPARTGMLLYLLPVYGVLLSLVFLGERLQPFHAAGLALVLPGVILATASPELARLVLRRRPAD